jgi:hypothetical protein
MTPEIDACFEVIEAVMRFQPKREFPVLRLEAWSTCASLRHPMQQLKQTIQAQDVFI